MSRLVIAAALIVSFTATVRAAAPTVASVAAVTSGSSNVVPCPHMDCVVAHPGVRA